MESKPKNRWRVELALISVLSVSSALHPTHADAAESAENNVQIRGTVFLDSNGNGRHDSKEKGMPGVPISDGDQIWTTGENGRYDIETTADIPNTVFVTNPDGYVSSGPFYHLIDRPSESLDFGLVPEPKSPDGSFSFFHAADYQFGNQQSARDQIEADLREMEALADLRDSRFYTFVGDITPHGSLPDLTFFRNRFSALARPFHALFGGHDGLVEMERPRMGNFVEVFGPYAYSWNHGGVHFIGLVSEGYLSNFERERQMRWWWRDMEMQPPGKPIVILAHVPDAIGDELDKASKTFNLLAILFGHWHTHHQYEVDGIPLFTSSPWRPMDWGAFTKRVRMFTYKNGGLTSTARVLEQKRRLTILAPGETADRGPFRVSASVYDTVVAPERVLATVHSASRERTWRIPLHQDDDWTWSSDFGDALPPGSYTVRIVVDGREEWSAERRFEIDVHAAAIETKHDWPSVLGGENRTRSSTSSLEPPFRLAWEYALGSTQPYFSSPIVLGGKVYQGVSDGQAGFENAGVVCLDARTGKRLWKRRLPHDINASVCGESGLVCALDGQGTLYGLDTADGHIRWQTDLYEGTGFYETKKFHWRTFIAPLTSEDGNLFAAGSRILAGIGASDGQKRWDDYKNLNKSAPYPLSALVPHNGTGYFEDEHKVAALDLRTGEVKWSRALKEITEDVPRERGTSSPLVAKDGVYFHHRTYLRKLDPLTGEKKWAAKTSGPLNYVSAPAIVDGKVVVGTANRIVALDAESGKPCWSFKTRPVEKTRLGKHQQLSNGSAPAIANGYVYVGSDDGYFYVLNLANGNKVWEFDTGTPIKSSPAISGNLVVVSNFSGNLLAFVGTQ